MFARNNYHTFERAHKVQSRLTLHKQVKYPNLFNYLSSSKIFNPLKTRAGKFLAGTVIATVILASVFIPLGIAESKVASSSQGQEIIQDQEIINQVLNNPDVQKRWITGAKTISGLTDNDIDDIFINHPERIVEVILAVSVNDKVYGCLNVLKFDCIPVPDQIPVATEQYMISGSFKGTDKVAEFPNEISGYNKLGNKAVSYKQKVRWSYDGDNVTDHSEHWSHWIASGMLDVTYKWVSADEPEKYYYNYDGHHKHSGLAVKRTAYFDVCEPTHNICYQHPHINVRTYVHGDGTFKANGEFVS